MKSTGNDWTAPSFSTKEHSGDSGKFATTDASKSSQTPGKKQEADTNWNGTTCAPTHTYLRQLPLLLQHTHTIHFLFNTHFQVTEANPHVTLQRYYYVHQVTVTELTKERGWKRGCTTRLPVIKWSHEVTVVYNIYTS